jgi:hypothetical protein
MLVLLMASSALPTVSGARASSQPVSGYAAGLERAAAPVMETTTCETWEFVCGVSVTVCETCSSAGHCSTDISVDFGLCFP